MVNTKVVEGGRDSQIVQFGEKCCFVGQVAINMLQSFALSSVTGVVLVESGEDFL